MRQHSTKMVAVDAQGKTIAEAILLIDDATGARADRTWSLYGVGRRKFAHSGAAALRAIRDLIGVRDVKHEGLRESR